MDIYEEIKMFTKPTFDKGEKMVNLVRQWKDYDYKIGQDLHDFYSFRDQNTKVSYEREEILPSLLHDENKEGYEELCSKKPLSVQRNLIVIENVNIYIKKVIDDELSPEELSAKIEDFHDEITDEIRESFKHDYCYDYICENKIVELEKIPGWAIDDLYDDLSLAEKDKLKTLNSIKNNDFKSAVLLLTKYYQKLSFDDCLNFMKEVVKIHGTDIKIINNAVSAVTERNNESTAFKWKLLNDTLKTEECKNAYNRTQNNDNEISDVLDKAKCAEEAECVKQSKQKSFESDIEISDVMEDDDAIYFHITQNGRGGYQNVEPSQLDEYLPNKEIITDEEFEKAIFNWASENLDISKLPNIEDATPAMQYLYNRVSSSENNMYYLDDVEDFNDELGMSQEEFEKQVDSDIEKFDLENVVVKDYDGALYACFGNLQCSFTEKVEQSNEKYYSELEAITNSVLDGKITWEEADKQYYSVHLKTGEFYDALYDLYRGSTISSEQSLDFMKDVVKEHGTDTEKLNEAVIAVTNFKGETSEFTAKLLQELLNSDEYKKIEREQGQRKVEGVDCVKQANAKTFEQDFLELCKSHNVSPMKAIKAMVNKMLDEKNKQNGVQR